MVVSLIENKADQKIISISVEMIKDNICLCLHHDGPQNRAEYGHRVTAARVQI